jgi:hypothetical protein
MTAGVSDLSARFWQKRDMIIAKRRHLGTLIIGGLAVLLAGAHAPPLLADDHNSRHYEDEEEHDHDRALEALKRGEVQPLEQVLTAVRSSVDGTIVRTRLERKRGAWVYELKVLGRDGRIHDIHVDARTASLLRD